MAPTFAQIQQVHQQVQPLNFPIQRELPLLARIDAASVAPSAMVAMPKTYREAVRLCWSLRRRKAMTLQQLAEEAELVRQHVSDYLAPDAPGRRTLPADRVHAFQAVCGNTLVTQWLCAQEKLTVLEEMQAERLAA
jgi:hypothetical protein